MTQHSKLVDGLTNATISPATENLQREIRQVLEATKEDSVSLKSRSGGSQRVGLSGGVGQGLNQAVGKFCRVQAVSTNTAVVRVRIGTVCGATDGVELPGNPVLTPYSVSNLNLLYFYSADANAIVDIEYFD